MEALLCEVIHMYNKSIRNPITVTGGIKMLTEFFLEFKNWWFGESMYNVEIEEFERIESKHTRVHHDEDIFEMIRVH
jgi:hypothetical protein